MRRQTESASWAPVDPFENRIECLRENFANSALVLDEKPSHQPVLTIVREQLPELLAGQAKERTRLLKALRETHGRPTQDFLEVAEDRIRFSSRFSAELFDPRHVDLPLVDVLAEFHRLVEERTHREVKELTRSNGGRTRAGEPKESVTVLLQAEENAALVVAHEFLDVGETQPVAIPLLDQPTEGLVGQQELSHDSDENGIRGGGSIRHDPGV